MHPELSPNTYPEVIYKVVKETTIYNEWEFLVLHSEIHKTISCSYPLFSCIPSWQKKNIRNKFTCNLGGLYKKLPSTFNSPININSGNPKSLIWDLRSFSIEPSLTIKQVSKSSYCNIKLSRNCILCFPLLHLQASKNWQASKSHKTAKKLYPMLPTAPFTAPLTSKQVS